MGEDDFRRAAFDLWRLLDDIDTASDIAKGDDARYRELVERTQKKRWAIIPEDEVDVLFARFLPAPREGE